MKKHKSAKWDKDFIPNAKSRRILDSSALELLLERKPETKSHFLSYMTVRLSEVEDALLLRIDREEKEEYLRQEIKEIRVKVEGDLINKILSLFQKKLRELQQLQKTYLANKSELQNVMPDKEKGLLAEPLFNIISKSITNTSITEKENQIALEYLQKLADYSGVIKEALAKEKPVDALVFYILYVYHEKKLLEKLIERLNEIKSYDENKTLSTSEQLNKTKEFTTSRQVLAVHYLIDELNTYSKCDKTEVARFIQFLTGKETGVGKISDTTIYKKIKKPLSKEDKSAEEDLRFIRNYFERLGLNTIVNKINKEIGSKE